MLDQISEPPLPLGRLGKRLEVLSGVVEGLIRWRKKGVLPCCRGVEGLHKAYAS